MEEIIRKFLAEQLKKNRKRFELAELQDYIIKYYKGNRTFQEKGGYREFCKQITVLKNNNEIKAIAAAPYNGLNPPLKLKWQIIYEPESQASRWNPSKMLKYSNLLDFSYYINNPSFQTELEWEYIENIYRFLQARDRREWVSVEERSLELFYDEKFLTSRKGSLRGQPGILSRLKLSYEDLKMKKYGEMFVYWKRDNREVKNIIIVENHSTFFTYKRIAERDGDILGFIPDMLIYGEGKKIENSLVFLEEFADMAEITILYFGDFDPEGLGIFYRLKARYPEVDISLQHRAYQLLLAKCNRDYPAGEQKRQEDYLEYFRQALQGYLTKAELDRFSDIGARNMRIPQELINYETLLQVKI